MAAADVVEPEGGGGPVELGERWECWCGCWCWWCWWCWWWEAAVGLAMAPAPEELDERSEGSTVCCPVCTCSVPPPFCVFPPPLDRPESAGVDDVRPFPCWRTEEVVSIRSGAPSVGAEADPPAECPMVDASE